MGQQAAVTLNTVVYSPAGSSNGVVKWVDRSGGVSGSFSTLTQTFAENSGADKLTKVGYRLDVPIVATADSSCSCTGAVLRRSSFQCSFWMDPNDTLADRTDLYLRAKDLLASTLLGSAAKDLDPAYA